MNANIKLTLCFLFLLLTVTGCSFTTLEKEPVENTAFLKVSSHLEVNNTNESLMLYDYKDTLASDGLYYASWRIGDPKPYENNDGDIVDLYDAQLYLLLGEFSTAENAQRNKDSWLERGRFNYEISGEEEIVCNDQTYQMITYTFSGANNPYARGISAFGAYENNAVCVELTCQEDFSEDLTAILTEFLENCTYRE